jgi:tetratricopeptide (TPR) repeat protein
MMYQEGEVLSHEIARPLPSIDGLAATGLAIVAGLLSFIVIPSSSVPFLISKIALIGFVSLAALACFIVGRMQERRIRLPRTLLFYAVWLLPIAYLLSSIFSSNVKLSLAGTGLSIDSAVFVTLLAVLFSVEVLLVRSKDKILQHYLAILGGGIILAVFQGLRLFIPENYLTLGVLSAKTTTLIGSWNSLSLFFGLIIVLSLITLISVRVEGTLRWIITAAIGLSLIFLGVIDYSLTWWLVGLFALAVFVYSISVGSYGRGSYVSGMSFAALLVLAFSIIFIIGGSRLQDAVSTGLGVPYAEIRPSWQSTVDIARQTLGGNFMFGSGPGTFAKQWQLYKPSGVNQSDFWNVDFASGIGFVPSTVATMGVLGVLAWALFFLALLYTGWKTLLRSGSGEDSVSYYLSLSSFIGSVYLWIAQILYTPGPVLLALAFVFTGLFVASLSLREGLVSEWMISFIDTPRIGFLAVLILTIAFLGSVAGIFTVGEVFASNIFFQKAVVTLNQSGDLGAAEANINRAISFGAEDEYYRLLAAVNVAKINQLATAQNKSPEQLRTEFQGALGTAVAAAQSATAVDAKNYQNWLTLAQVYQSVVPLKIQGAYENAQRAYEEAIKLNPHSPAIFYSQAQLAVAAGNLSEAEKYVIKAIQEKGNYTDAIFLLSQIQINEGKIDDAMRAVEAATIIDPNNPVAFFQLGVLRYSKQDYAGTIVSLEQAVALSPNYANARYFLGLSYAATNRKDDAIKQFEAIEKLNPDNQEVKTVLQNMRSGKEPFSQTAATKVQDLKTLPVPDSKKPEGGEAE